MPNDRKARVRKIISDEYERACGNLDTAGRFGYLVRNLQEFFDRLYGFYYDRGAPINALAASEIYTCFDECAILLEGQINPIPENKRELWGRFSAIRHAFALHPSEELLDLLKSLIEDIATGSPTKTSLPKAIDKDI